MAFGSSGGDEDSLLPGVGASANGTRCLVKQTAGGAVAQGSNGTGRGEDKYYAGSLRKASDAAISCKGQVTRDELTEKARGLVIVMVGLPGRGKSFISRKLQGFLKWQGKKCETFNAGKYRRESEGAVESGRAEFFDSSNPHALALRKQAATMALNDLLEFLDGGGEVAIFDATNSTHDRRQMILDEANKRPMKYHVIFVEVLCDDPEVLRTNFRNKVRHSPDFSGMDEEEAIRDLEARVKMYEDRYEEVADDTMSYIKLYNMSSKVLVNRIYGSITKSLLPYAMGIHIGTRPIWLVRTAQVPAAGSQDAELTDEGILFAERLGAFVRRRLREYHGEQLPEKPVRVLSSTVTSCVQTVTAFLQSGSDFAPQVFRPMSALNPIDRGRLGGSWWIDLCTDKPPFEKVRECDPSFYSRWEDDKLHCRFPGGESYHDVMCRSESVLLEIEMSTRPVLCVSHITCIQVLLSYFRGSALEDAWDLAVPEHHVFEIVPTLGGGFTVEVVNVDTEPL